jgi:hypothetical protein
LGGRRAKNFANIGNCLATGARVALPLEDQHIKQLSGNFAGNFGYRLIFKPEAPYLHRTVNPFLVNEVLWY